MQYKVGDEVLIKGEVVEVAKDVTYPIGVRLRCATVPMLFTEEELELSMKTYEMGLNDAWELAKRLVCQKEQDGITARCFNDAFGELAEAEDVFSAYTYEEALAKIEAYEREKAVCVGDVVKVLGGDGKGVIVSVGDGAAHILWADGVSGVYTKSHIEKTGKHIDIEGLLKQIGE